MMEQLSKIWSRLPAAQRLFIVVIGVTLIAILILVGSWAGREEYGVLYANLEPDDAGAVVEQLQSQGIPYRLSNGGRTVTVPRDRVYDTRLTLASGGLPNASGQGYELLDSNKMGWTDFVQKLQFRRALEGEIGRTIQALEAVQHARVHIVMPEPSLFVEEERLPTASVMVKVRAGASLREGEVGGIVNLVAASVEGLSPENVTVLDTRGRLLSRRQDQASLLGSTADQIELVRGLEEGLARKAQSALEQVLGPNKAVVRVNAEVDFERIERTREIYDSENPVVRSEQRSEQSAGEEGTSESSTTNYEISKTLEHIVETPGTVERLTASVFVDGSYDLSPEGERVYVPRPPEEMEKLTGLIESAIGYNAERGDVLTVENVAFDVSEVERTRQALEESQRFERMREIGSVAISMLLGLGALFLLWRMISRARVGITRAREAYLQENQAELIGPAVSQKGTESVRIEKRLQQISQEPPEAIARVVRAWLTE
jgi:flagellar M-ring protein FliF